MTVRHLQCSFCDSTTNLQVHHIIPLSKGGDPSFLNRKLLCIKCHIKIHSHGVGSPRKKNSYGYKKPIIETASTRKTNMVFCTMIDKSLTKVMKKYLKIGTYVTKSDFVRDAIREKIRREAPHIFEDIMKRGEE